MSDISVQGQPNALQDRASLIDVVCRFAVSIDRRRWDDFASCFAERVEINTVRTGTWVSVGRDEIVATQRRVFESYTATQHLSTNHQVTIDGDRAIVVATLNATHYLEGAAGGDFHQQVGYYEYQLARENTWRITGVEQFLHWQRGNQAIFDRTLPGTTDATK